ncbi:MAG: putative motility protein [Epsilonproteobacteria bacterium]|nr:putative motility protein [Campylobacterota bacterium]
MGNVGMSNASLMAQVQADTMKKAMDVQEREVLSLLQNTLQTPTQNVPSQNVAALTGLGQKLDIKG